MAVGEGPTPHDLDRHVPPGRLLDRLVDDALPAAMDLAPQVVARKRVRRQVRAGDRRVRRPRAAYGRLDLLQLLELGPEL